MKRLTLTLTAVAMAAASLAYSPAVSAQSQQVDVTDSVGQFASVLTPEARQALAVTPADSFLSVVVRLDDQVDLSKVLTDAGPTASSEDVVRSLQDAAARDQFLYRVLAPIWELGPDVEEFTPFWIMNGFAITATPGVIADLARFDDVAEIDIEHQYQLAGTAPAGPATANVDAIGAPAMWAAGNTGEGVVVAVLDTGVDIVGIPNVFPSEVVRSYRGGTNSWFDPYGGSTEPYDTTGHGTAVANIITGGDLSGSTVGVAPDAQWIAAKIFDDRGNATTSAIHSALQWVLDPDGDPTTDDGADVVNSSWTGATPGCDLEFAPDIAALRAAGVIPVFAAGNFGPGPGSSPSPSNLPGALAVGAVRSDLSALSESSRGPTECGGATRTYPHVAAPGELITAQTVAGEFVPHSGTSFAAPHVAGAVALLVGASPTATDSEIEAALIGGATDLGDPGADDVFGAGLVDLVRSSELLGGTAPDPTASVSGIVFQDSDGNGSFDPGELPTGSVQIGVTAAGADATYATADDTIVAEAVTGPDGSWLFNGLAPGAYRVSVAPTSLPLDSVLTTPGFFDLDLAAGTTSSAEFGWRPPSPGSLLVSVFDDLDGDGLRGGATEVGLVDIGVTVEAAGADDRFGTLDDAGPVYGITDAAGVFEIQGLPPGPARVTLRPDSLPERGFVSGVVPSSIEITSDAVTTVEFGVNVPARGEPVLYVSLKRAGRTNNGTLGYRDEDILTWDGTRFEMLFDGSDVGLAGRDIDAFHIVDDHTILLSVDRPFETDDLGLVSDSDVLRFDAEQLGESTRGTFSVHLRGIDIGMNSPAADIDAITMFDGDLVVSIRGNVELEGLGSVRDEDLLRVTMPTDPDTAPGVSTLFDGSGEGLIDRSEDIDAAAVLDGHLSISSLGPVSVGFVRATDGDVIACGGLSSCSWNVTTPGAALGLSGGDLDGLDFPKGIGE